ncbi:hypothetical protein P3C33_27710 [Mesorhizobium sp. P16.1]|uniref:hypothetical protein n=1 Tax=unclassified Mesorhizobium TaxID=325217 RepID=UPI0021A4B939|nr:MULTISPECIES: hypothetical protein [unclassified Mesorhizobium]MCT2580922.1 hypothetical protein [Mesorhizobium sp. P13.3]MDF3169939.1 hypothetical protein [Mesorhizobium sp. P16.1]MDF3181309.1 hypothetical protein [Mesorhizobium sp. P17.1]MDF3186898.1 hypothetical protein [Mesorhizobium sp. ICCV3110.1]
MFNISVSSVWTMGVRWLASLIFVFFLASSDFARAEDFWSKTWREINNAGKDINKGAIAIGKGVEHLGQEIGKGAEHLGNEVNKEFCDLMTMGRYSKGEASCGTNAGVGYDEQGTYTYNPSEPDQKYRGSSGDRNNGPSDQRLSEMARSLHESQIATWEYEDEDVYGIRRFLLPDKTLGEAWPNAERELRPVTSSGEIRPCCKGGGGGFLATRADHGSLRFHAGVDYVNRAGDPLFSPMDGWVERIKNPGRPGLSGLLIVNEKGYKASIYYVEPTAAIRQAISTKTVDGITKNRFKVTAGETVIGIAQDIHPAYPADVPQHVHVTLEDPAGNPVSPDGRTRLRRTPNVTN